MPNLPQLPDPPKRPGFKEFSPVKKIYMDVLNVIGVVVALGLLIAVFVFRDLIEYLGWIVLIVALLLMLLASPIVLIMERIKMKKRIDYLEGLLRGHDIPYRPDE